MKLILIDGGPASGKNTLGELLVELFQRSANKAILLDLDTYVEQLNPTWVWSNETKKAKDLKDARINFAHKIDQSLSERYVVVAIGERFMTKKNIRDLTDKLAVSCPIYLYHLSVPLELRRERLHKRGPHSLINLDKDQKDRDLNPKWYGLIYSNINSTEKDATQLFNLVKDGLGNINDIL
jgi:thymidylate kinase